MRRQALDIFVNRIASHHELQQSEDLRTFLQADEEVMFQNLFPCVVFFSHHPEMQLHIILSGTFFYYGLTKLIKDVLVCLELGSVKIQSLIPLY